MPGETHVARCTYHRGIIGEKVAPDSPETRKAKREVWVAAGGQKLHREPRRLKVHQDELVGATCHRYDARCEWLEFGKCTWFGDKLEKRLSKKTGKPSRKCYLRTAECVGEKAPRKENET